MLVMAAFVLSFVEHIITRTSCIYGTVCVFSLTPIPILFKLDVVSFLFVHRAQDCVWLYFITSTFAHFNVYPFRRS